MLYGQHLANIFQKNTRKVKKNNLHRHKALAKTSIYKHLGDTTKIPYIEQLYLTDLNDNNEFQR
jgi:hypothetical protein